MTLDEGQVIQDRMFDLFFLFDLNGYSTADQPDALIHILFPFPPHHFCSSNDIVSQSS